MISTPTLLFTLPLTSPLLPTLLSSHRPFARPSLLPQSQATKWIQRVNAAIISREPAQLAAEERKAAVGLAGEVVRQDGEGWAVAGWGKGWMGAALGMIHTPLPILPPYLDLLLALLAASSSYPSFERESIHPITGKLAIGMIKLLERALSAESKDWVAMLSILQASQSILAHAPASFRPLATSLRTHLLPLILAPHSPTANAAAPDPIRQAALDLFTSLYITAGKAQASQAWAADMRLVLNGARGSMDGVRRDGWDLVPEGDIVDPVARLPVALDALQGWVDIVITYLRKPTARPVPIPIGPIVSLAVRCLDLSIDTSVVEYITPQHHAALIAALPRIWSMGMLLVGHLASTCGDHLLPHLAEIVDSTAYLAESVPRSMIQTQTQLLRTHRLLLTLYPPSTLPAEHATRLLKDCLSKLSIVVDIQKAPTASGSSAGDANGSSNGQGGSKKGKKRARGGEEDGLVGAFEGRGGKKIGDEWVVVDEALKLTPLLHLHPLIAPSLLTLSVRLHLSLHLLLPELPRDTFTSSPQSQGYLDGQGQGQSHAQMAIAAAVREALEAACTSHGERGGWRMGWSNIILGVLSPSPNTAALLHPSVPPLLRPAPPLSALHFYTTESAEEKKLRRELGLKVVRGRRGRGRGAEGDEGVSGDEDADDSESENGDGGMDVDGDEDEDGDGPVVNRPRLGGGGVGGSKLRTAATSSSSAGHGQAGPASGQEEVTLVVPVAPQDVRSGRPSLDLAAGAPLHDDPALTGASDEAASAARIGQGPNSALAPEYSAGAQGMEVDDVSTTVAETHFIQTPLVKASSAGQAGHGGQDERAHTGEGKGKGKEAEIGIETVVQLGSTSMGLEGEEDDDEAIPELDSGMSDFDDDEEEEEE